MAADPVRGLLDAIVTTVTTAWADKGAADVVKWHPLFPVNLDRSERFAGRAVVFFPTADDEEVADRGEDDIRYMITCWVAEQCQDAIDMTSDAAKTWFIDRLDFVYTCVREPLDFGRRTKNGLLAVGSRRIWTQSRSRVIYDANRLSEQKLFVSQMEFVFREIAA